MSVDFLIAGQGLAGSLLGWYLRSKGASIYITDPMPEVSSSVIAAGIMHPFTGRRLAKTWMADTLIPFAQSAYREISRELNAELFYESELIELFTSVQHSNEWNARSADPSCSGYVNYIAGRMQLPATLVAPYGGISLKSSWLDVKMLTDCLRQLFIRQNIFRAGSVDENSLKVNNGHVQWDNITAGKVIFCNGYKAKEYGLFNRLPFVPAKGELIEIYSPELKVEHIYNRSIYIVPCGKDHYKVGSTFNWTENDEVPTLQGLEYLKDELSKMISCSYSVTRHVAAIRPTNKDRRPFIGMHPHNRQVGIFNGLGTKGVMLAPWFADQFSDELLTRKPVDKVVSIERYAHLL